MRKPDPHRAFGGNTDYRKVCLLPTEGRNGGRTEDKGHQMQKVRVVHGLENDEEFKTGEVFPRLLQLSKMPLYWGKFFLKRDPQDPLAQPGLPL